MHTLIVGTTGSGKSTLAKLLCSKLTAAGKRCAVLTPTREAGWEAEYKTTLGSEFLNYVQTNQELFCFVDESGDAIGKYNDEMDWLATGSRHLGHSVSFCVQSSQQISTAIRSCCGQAFVFATSKGVLKLVGEDFNADDLIKYKEAIPQYHFIKLSRFGKMQFGRLDNMGKAVKMDVDFSTKGAKNVEKQDYPDPNLDVDGDDDGLRNVGDG